MAEEVLYTNELRDDFYRENFGSVIIVFSGIILSICLLVAISIYAYMNKPPPITFPVSEEWRVQPDIPLDQPYRTTPDVLQWTSDAVLEMFVFDFNFYDAQKNALQHYFTSDGWAVFLNQLNNHANSNTVLEQKLFVSDVPTGAPVVINQGVLSGRYAWWVQIPVEISYVGIERSTKEQITLQLLVVRVPTLNNLSGLAIDNVIVLTNDANAQ